MTLTGQPPAYTRGYSFTTHSAQQPNVPQPGDRLDAEFDDISTAVNSYITSLRALTNGDGTLKNGSVGQPQLAPGLFNVITADAAAAVQPLVDDADDSAAAAAASAAQAAASAVAAASSAQVAQSAATTTQGVAQASIQAKADAQAAASTATTKASLADNSASTAEDAMVNSIAASEFSFKWAEYLAGPVQPAPPGWPEAIDDGLWSSKWWALRAREIVGAWGGLYLGAFPTPPVPDGSNPWPPGTIYYDTTLGEMLVWDGTSWNPITQPGPSVASTFVYKATAGQQDFSGPDANGQTPAINASRPQPNDVHVNGVRLVQDQGAAIGGDYTVDPNASALHIGVPLAADSIVQWDLLLTPADLAPGSVIAYKLHDVDRDPVTNEPGEFDGVRTTFPMLYTGPDSATHPAMPGSGVQLQVSLDGVMQEFGVDFTTSGTDMVFSEPPPPKTRFWAVWYQPGVAPP